MTELKAQRLFLGVARLVARVGDSAPSLACGRGLGRGSAAVARRQKKALIRRHSPSKDGRLSTGYGATFSREREKGRRTPKSTTRPPSGAFDFPKRSIPSPPETVRGKSPLEREPTACPFCRGQVASSSGCRHSFRRSRQSENLMMPGRKTFRRPATLGSASFRRANGRYCESPCRSGIRVVLRAERLSPSNAGHLNKQRRLWSPHRGLLRKTIFRLSTAPIN